MTEFYRKSQKVGQPGKSLSASHQRSWLWGRHAVMETLRTGRWPMTQLLIASELADEEFDGVWRLATALGVDLERPPAKRLEQLCKSPDHQGFLAQMAEFPCESDDTLLELVKTRPESHQIDGRQIPCQLFLVCDRIQDSHNFGAILRCCDAMGVAGVIIGAREQASVTPHVARASSGAVNFLRIFRTENLPGCLRLLKENSVFIAGASEKASEPAWQSSLTGPAALVIGSEARGISSEIVDVCDGLLRIPMLGRGESLNAAVAAGILLYEIRRQQHPSQQQALRSRQNCTGADDVA